MKKILPGYPFLLGLAGLIVVLDQWSKAYVRASLELGSIWSPWEWLTPYARIVHWSNTGVAFGMFQGKGDIFKVLAFIVAAVIIFYYPRVPARDWPLRVAMGMQLGGAVGNLIDRVIIGEVTDFISIGAFPVFNVADSSITVGVIILILGIWIQERNDKKRQAASVPINPAGETPPDGTCV